jgi:hypothetical protein
VTLAASMGRRLQCHLQKKDWCRCECLVSLNDIQFKSSGGISKLGHQCMQVVAQSTTICIAQGASMGVLFVVVAIQTLHDPVCCGIFGIGPQFAASDCCGSPYFARNLEHCYYNAAPGARSKRLGPVRATVHGRALVATLATISRKCFVRLTAT